MKYKIWKVLFILFIVFLIVLSLSVAFSKKFENKTAPGRLTIKTITGNVSIADITLLFEDKTLAAFEFAKTDSFAIEYYKADQAFNIVILKKPLNESRGLAEEEFLKILDISRGQACQLSVTVMVPRFVSEKYPSENIGFSFCPGSVGVLD